jgi:hypothetical protein
MTAEEIRAGILDPKKLPLPEKPVVTDIRVVPIQDHTGQDALEVWVIVDEATTRADRTVDNRRAIRRAIRDALLAAGIDLFPYLHLATWSELREAEIKL